MANNIEVLQYDFDELERLFAEKAKTSLRVVSGKSHTTYFRGYLQEMGAQTFVIEDDYVDRDFLDDFSSYYIRCFESYSHRCSRFHFFAFSFTLQDFKNFLQGADSVITVEKLQDSYLGFVVVKPLPLTIIGRTCLKTYPSDSGKRFFPITRRYNIHLFGIPLHVETLAFQEQDTVVAACATSALWSAFQGTGMLFQHPIPSPVNITKAANTNFPITTRYFPSKGLKVTQMALAIRSVGLEPFLIEINDEYTLKKNLYAYLRGRIPSILGFGLVNTNNHAPSIDGFHAVAVTGYRLSESSVIPVQPHNFHLRASRIEKIYVHDDQVGPFARMLFDGLKVHLSGQGSTSQPQDSLTTSWGLPNSYRAVPFALLVPLYNKIRIPFSKIEGVVIRFNALVEILRSKYAGILKQNLEWDIYLTTANSFKEDILASNDISHSAREEILLQAMPRFLWRSTAYCEDLRVLDLLFDATDIEQGRFFVRAVEYDLNFSTVLRSISKSDKLEQMFNVGSEWRILAWFRAQLDI